MNEQFTISVKNCARCGHNHDRVTFYPFKLPVVHDGVTLYTHYGICSETGEPILLRIEDDHEICVTTRA